MNMTTIRTLGALVALAISMPAVAASQERAGIATTVVGPVTVTHVSMPPAPLNFKDDVLLNDRIATGEKAFARVLLGGKAVVTAREHSVITITEAPGTSTIDLLSGRISVNVDKSKMRAGDLVQVKTPNAVAGIRGTIVVADAAKNRSTITVLRGLVDVYRRDPVTGNAFGPAVPVGVREAITVNANVLPARPQPISVENARQLSNDFTPPVRPILMDRTMSVNDEVTRARDLIGVLAPAAPAEKDTTPSRDTLTNRGESADKNDKNDKGERRDRVTDRLERATERLDRATDKLDKADKLDKGDRLDRATERLDRVTDRLEKIDRITDRLDRGETFDKADKLFDRGMAAPPDAGGPTERRAMPTIPNALPGGNPMPNAITTGNPPTPPVMPPIAVATPTVMPTLPMAPMAPMLTMPSVAPPPAPMPNIPVVPHSFNHNKFKKQ